MSRAQAGRCTVRKTWAQALHLLESPKDQSVEPAASTAAGRPAEAATAELAAKVVQTVSTGRIVSVRLVGHGYSNATYRVSTAAGRTVAVQFATRDPSSAGMQGGLLPLLSDRLPVPEVIECDAEGTRFGMPTLVTNWVEGAVLEQVLPSLAASDAQALGQHAAELLARMEEFEAAVPGFLAGPSLHLIGRRKQIAAAVRDHVRDRVFRGQSAPTLPLELRHRLWTAVDQYVDILTGFEHERTLVHADLTPRNILIRRRRSGWQIGALLDWEFSYFGSPLLDVGRLLRVRDGSGAFIRAVADEFAYRHPGLPGSWRLAAWLFDSVALSGPLARPPAHPALREIRREIQHALSILPTTAFEHPNER